MNSWNNICGTTALGNFYPPTFRTLVKLNCWYTKNAHQTPHVFHNHSSSEKSDTYTTPILVWWHSQNSMNMFFTWWLHCIYMIPCPMGPDPVIPTSGKTSKRNNTCCQPERPWRAGDGRTFSVCKHSGKPTKTKLLILFYLFGAYFLMCPTGNWSIQVDVSCRSLSSWQNHHHDELY